MSHFCEERALPEPKKETLIACTRGNKPLTPEDKKALQEWVAFVKARAAKKKGKKK